MKIEVYCDGSSQGDSDGKGGWAYVIVIDGVATFEGSGHLARATNNVAEITAGIEGLSRVSTDPILSAADEIVLVSDSQLVLHFADGSWQCKKWHLVPLTIKLKKLYSSLKANTRWVKGHSGEEHNERCDVLAKSARDQQVQDPKPTV